MNHQQKWAIRQPLERMHKGIDKMLEDDMTSTKVKAKFNRYGDMSKKDISVVNDCIDALAKAEEALKRAVLHFS